MKLANILRSIIFASAAAFLIFNQDHSVPTGIAVVQYVSTAIAFGSAVLYKIDSSENKLGPIVVPGAIAFIIALMSIFVAPETPEVSLTLLTGLIAAFAGGNAITEFVISLKSPKADKLELRISAAIGFLTALVFGLGQLDGLNAVGFFSAYLSVLAVQRAVWIASPKSKDENG
ncbi:MAG: hypothetical protein JHD31_01370 [Rhodoluna sp.]|jgi:hypothetical protein|nr:hypothetical protein [Rhodoluna sp.]